MIRGILRTGTAGTLASAAVVVLASFASIIVAAPGERTWAGAASIAVQMLPPAALAGSVFLFIAWRLDPRSGVAWVAAANLVVGLQTLPMLATGAEGGGSEETLLASTILFGFALLALVRVAERRYVEIAPIPAGVCLGIVLVTLRSVDLPALAPDLPFADGNAVLILVAGLALAVALHHNPLLAHGSRRRVTAAVTWSLAGSLVVAGVVDRPAWGLLAITAGLATCVLTASNAVDVLLRATHHDQEALLHMQQELLMFRDRAREGVEQLHEVRGTIAGIASATDLIRHAELDQPNLERLKSMLAQEAARLQRLVHAEPRSSDDFLEIDEIVRPLVTARRIQGQEVLWCPPTIPVRAHADELAEVVNILLQNAAEHAPGAAVRLFTRIRDGAVELLVADDGPGVPAELRERIFDWGYNRPGSRGQGVGLAMAHELAGRHGGSLRLDPYHRVGATFVIRFGQERSERVDAHTPAIAV